MEGGKIIKIAALAIKSHMTLEGLKLCAHTFTKNVERCPAARGAMFTRAQFAASLIAMFPRSLRRVLAFLCAMILMSSQMAVAAYACPLSASMEASAAVEETNMPPDCAQEMSAKPSPLCKAHCDQSSQSNQVPALDLLPVVLLSLWIAPSFDPFDPTSSRPIPDEPRWLADGSPPLRIQYQVFRI